MEKLIEKYQAKHEKVLNAYQTKKDLTEDDRMYLRDKMHGLLEIIEDLKSVGKEVNTEDSGLHLQRVSQRSELACDLLRKISNDSMCSVVADEWIHEFLNSQACG